HVAHDIQIMHRKVDDDTDISDPRREWPLAMRVHLKDTPEPTRCNLLFQSNDSRVEAFDVPDHQLYAFLFGSSDDFTSFIQIKCNGLFDQKGDPTIDDLQSYIPVVKRGHSNRYCIRL